VKVDRTHRSLELAVRGRLYPSVILHGGSESSRFAAALTFARALLCERDAGERPCGDCRHCRRVALPDLAGDEPESFHPDFYWLVRDLKTSTSAEAVREMLRSAQLAPYEARGQVYVVAEAASLSSEASDALLKAIEEPIERSPRNFFLLAPSRLDLSPTLRSRSLAIYLGAPDALPEELLAAVAVGFRTSVERFAAGGGAHWLLDAANRLDPVGKRTKAELEAAKRRGPAGDGTDALGFEDPRAQQSWLFAAAAVRRAALGVDGEAPPEATLRRRMLALAEELLTASPLRLRGIPAERILEGLVSRHIAG
jgi:hypothetical protein